MVAKTKVKEETTTYPPAIEAPAQQTTAVTMYSAVSQVSTVIEKAIYNPKLDVKKMQAVMDMQIQAMRFQSEIAYNQAMCDCQGDIPQIKANKRNEHTKSSYADLSAIDTAIRPIYKKFGFSLSFDTDHVENGVNIICWVRHRDGHKERHTLAGNLDMTGAKGTANKTSIQGTGSTVSYLQRYLTKLIFNVVIEGEDVDGNADKLKKKDEDDFSALVAAETKKPPVEDNKVWNGSVNNGAGDIIIDPTDGNLLVTAAIVLMDAMKTHKLKEKRIHLINLNLPLIKAMAKASMGKTIDKLHKFAGEGE